MGFWKPHMHELDRSARFLERTSYDLHDGRACPDTGLNCLDIDNPNPHWGDLSVKQREEVLTRYIDWTNFKPQEIDQVVSNIAAGAERARWFEGVEMEADTAAWHADWLRFQSLSPEEQLRELAADVKRNGSQVHIEWAEMTPSQRDEVVNIRLPSSDDLGIEFQQHEAVIEAELGNHRSRTSPQPMSEYDRMLKEAAEMAKYRTNDRDLGGPER